MLHIEGKACPVLAPRYLIIAKGPSERRGKAPQCLADSDIDHCRVCSPSRPFRHMPGRSGNGPYNETIFILCGIDRLPEMVLYGKAVR